MIDAPKRARWRGWALVVLAIAVVVVLGRVLPVSAWFTAFNDWVASQGAWAPVVFGGAYVLATVFMLPGSALTLGAGALFGVVQGTAIVSVASTLAAAVTFLLGRLVVRERVTRRFGAHPRYVAIDRAIVREGAKIVLLLRLSPVVPFNVLNYLLGLTAVKFWTAVFWSWLGMLPGTLLYVYLGWAARAGLTAAEAEHVDWKRLSYYALGLAATIVVVVVLARLSRRALRSASEEAGF